MTEAELAGLIEFLRQAERLKTVKRSGFTSTGEPESVAEHSWRLSLLALIVAPPLPGVDVGRVLKICIVHDLGEAIGGDVPAPEQARRQAAGLADGKGEQERADLLTLVQPLPPSVRAEITALWDEYESAQTAEARLAKGLDKLETILQHVEGENPADFDYDFNLNYGRAQTAAPPLVAAIRRLLDEATQDRARRARRRSSADPTPTPDP